jgi:hypothetical protein
VTRQEAAGAVARAGKEPAQMLSRRAGSFRWREDRAPAAVEAQRPSTSPTAPSRRAAWSRAPCRACPGPGAVGREAEPDDLRRRSTARRYGCPGPRGRRCSGRSRHCCSGRRLRLGAEAVPAVRGRPTARSRTSPSRQVPPTRRSTGASKPSRAVWEFAAYSPCAANRSTCLQISAILGSEGVPHPREQDYARPVRAPHHNPVPRGPRRRV